MSKPLFFYYALTMLPLAGFAFYDYRHHRIRNAALLAFLPWCLLYLPVAAYARPGTTFPEALLHCTMGFLSGFLLLLSVSLATDGGIGGGDIKLAALLGIPFGASGLMAALALSCFFALLHLGIRRACKRKAPGNIPFAPYLFFGCLAVTLIQHFHRT
ncbi:prepilin peptidase [uncultured Acetatifactor sp.]|uniref:prepilin peptidase n=1 Tax=uncultured Acetatifactor sp. TaxID=1671927 RepID=UPI002609A4FE|nr:prepilin peptidase [uncultured Acetatifactor sp.]